MKTPITDNLFAPMWLLDGPPTDVHLYEAQKSHRRLELDRAALMEALEEFLAEMGAFRSDLGVAFAMKKATASLSAARANFPDA